MGATPPRFLSSDPSPVLPAHRGCRETTVSGVLSGFLVGSGGRVNAAPVASSCPRRRLPGAWGAAEAWVSSLPHGGCALFTSPLSLSPELCVNGGKSRFRAPTLQACGSWVGRPLGTARSRRPPSSSAPGDPLYGLLRGSFPGAEPLLDAARCPAPLVRELPLPGGAEVAVLPALALP